MKEYELAVIGAGAAGLAAGIYAARSGLKAVIIDQKIAGGTIIDAPLVQNYPGFENIGGQELAQKLVYHCKNSGTQIHELEQVTKLKLNSETKFITTNKSTYNSKSIIIATGSHYRRLNIPGEKEFQGRGVSYCGICDGPLFTGKNVLVVGGGNSALITSIYLAGLASKVSITHRRESFRAEEALVKEATSKLNIETLWMTELKEIKGEKLVNKAVLLDKKAEKTLELPFDGVFVQIGEDPNSQLAKEAGIETNEECFIKTDMHQRTNIQGVLAAGDVTNHPVKQIGTAIGQGITAALEAHSYIRRPYYRL